MGADDMDQEILELLKAYSETTRPGPFHAEKNHKGGWDVVDSKSSLILLTTKNSFPMIQENHAKLVCILLNNYRKLLQV